MRKSSQPEGWAPLAIQAVLAVAPSTGRNPHLIVLRYRTSKNSA